jgi:hypothetical protein
MPPLARLRPAVSRRNVTIVTHRPAKYKWH